MGQADFLKSFPLCLKKACSKHQGLFQKVHNLLAKLLSVSGFALHGHSRHIEYYKLVVLTSVKYCQEDIPIECTYTIVYTISLLLQYHSFTLPCLRRNCHCTVTADLVS